LAIFRSTKIDWRARKVLTIYNTYHPEAEMKRVYLKRREDERDLLQIKATYKTEIINTAEYLNTKYKEQFLNIVEG
jgi:hypothetical protein